MLEPFLGHAAVGLVEIESGAELPGIHFAAMVHAPAATLAQVIGDPTGYPSFMPAVSDVTLHDASAATDAGVIGFTWHWQSSIFQLGGDAMLTTFAPPARHPERGYRISLERTRGDLGRGRELWRIVPRGADACLVILSTRVDLRDENPVMRQVANGSRSLNRSVNIAMGFASLLRSQEEAERRAGYVAARPDRELHRPDVSLPRLEGLLRRGDMLLIESDGARLRQSSVITRLERDVPRVRSIMLDPIAFSEALISGSRTVIREQTEEGTRFDWGMDTPLVGSAGTMLLREEPDHTVALDAVAGALDGGRWRFATERLPSGATAVLGWATFEPADANFVLRAIVDADPAFAPGLGAATEIMLARALRIRVFRND